ncbi:hypothetical protein AB0J80_35975 [Actinoplanes sp. NPDC049548]|uniref:hypothetical protein n=1 Tax=Actinoplanes sp. NPDC049548 TaxID=3155152 RepID=UPI00341CE520
MADAPTLIEPTKATVTLVIDNHYELYDTVTVITTVTIPLPPSEQNEEAYDAWSYDHIYAETGTGRTDGDSWYFVRVTESTAPELLGREFEFGL